MLSAARLQRGIFGAGFARLAEAALTEELTFRRRALAFHLWQSRAEDEWNHPDDEHFPEDFADCIHYITVAKTKNLLPCSMPMSQTGFTRTSIFVKIASKLFGYRLRLHGTVNQRFREVPICSRQVAYRRIDHPYVRVLQAVGCCRVEHECFLPRHPPRTDSHHVSAARRDFPRQCARLLVEMKSHPQFGTAIAF